MCVLLMSRIFHFNMWVVFCSEYLVHTFIPEQTVLNLEMLFTILWPLSTLPPLSFDSFGLNTKAYSYFLSSCSTQSKNNRINTNKHHIECHRCLFNFSVAELTRKQRMGRRRRRKVNIIYGIHKWMEIKCKCATHWVHCVCVCFFFFHNSYEWSERKISLHSRYFPL